MNLNDKQFRQGDCMIDASLLVKSALPEGLEDITPKEGRVILMSGEATNHHHAFYEGGVRIFREKGKAGRPTYLQVVKTEAKLFHEEHGAPMVRPGIYRIPSQVEHNDDFEPRVVAD